MAFDKQIVALTKFRKILSVYAEKKHCVIKSHMNVLLKGTFTTLLRLDLVVPCPPVSI
jgi:hypothetical protein